MRSSKSSARFGPASSARWTCARDALTTPERLALLESCEEFRRLLPAVEHPLINQLSEQADETELGGKLAAALANRLRITRADASRRIHEAADLGERKALNGEPLPPLLPATAEAQRNGDLGAGHVAVIRSFWHRLPDFVDIETGHKAEAQLARLAGEHRPDELAQLADTLTDCLNPDGDFTEHDRARRRGITLGRQDIDGMSPISGYLTPEARATLDAVLAKLAAPGMCNSADASHASAAPRRSRHPTTPATPDNATTTPSSRRHARPGLGRTRSAQRPARQHRGHHHAQRARGRRGQGAHRRRHPAADVRCDPTSRPRPPLPGHLRQRQSAGALSHQAAGLTGSANCVVRQRPRVHVPWLPVPANLCETHHCNPYATNPVTDINDLTLACHPNHQLAEQGWTTRKNHHGDTEWIPPAHLDHGQPRTNTYHHPEKLLCDDDP